MNLVHLSFFLLLLAGCAPAVPPSDTLPIISPKEVSQEPVEEELTVPSTDPYFCITDSDCEVKDVRNCCGYFPRCVNKDYTPDHEAVRQACKEGRGNVECGWTDITYCACRENICLSFQNEIVISYEP